MKVEHVVLLVVAIATLSGCGSSSTQDTKIVLGDSYDEKPGDVFTTTSTVNADYSNGQIAEITSINVETYTQVSDIPEKYGYSNSNNGPFLLKTDQSDGEFDGLDYMTVLGEFIIEDDLDYFSSVEYTTQNGSENPEHIRIGDEFSSNQNSTLFDSKTGAEAGYNITNTNFVVIQEENITVPAGVFDAIKISYSFSSTKSENDIIDTSSGSGYGWFDTKNGFLLKLVIEAGDIVLGEHNVTASFSAETVLQNYSISNSNSVKKSRSYITASTTPYSGINPKIIFHNLNNSIPITR
jgi:hypothetical protein